MRITRKGKANSVITNLSSGFNSGTTAKPTLEYNSIEETIGSGIYRIISVNVGVGKCNLYTTSDFVGYPIEYTIPAKLTMSLAYEIPNYLCAKLINGVPSYVIVTDKSLINQSNIFPIYTIVISGDEARVTDWDSPGWGLPNKLLKRDVETDRFSYVSGLLLGELGTRNITVSSGKVWTGVYENYLSEVNSSVDVVRLVHTIANGSWEGLDITQYPNTQYDTGHGLAVLTTGTDAMTYRYAVLWVYRSSSNVKALEVFLGNGNYTLEEAKASQEPSVPEAFKTNAFLVGRIIVKKSDNIATQIDKAWSTKFSSSISSDHNSLTNKEGGGLVDSTPHYYHSDQPINKLSEVTFAKITAQSATETVNGLMTTDQVKKINKLALPIKNMVDSTTAPTVTDDNTKGYSATGGSTWTQIDGENTITYVCADDTTNNAIWVNTSNMFIFDTWNLFVSAISVADTTYVGKYVVVLNASGGVAEGDTYIAPNPILTPIGDSGSSTYKVNAQGTNWSVTCKKHEEEAVSESLDIVGQIKEYAGFTCPSGHLWARGQAIPRATYTNLLKATTIESTSASITINSNIITLTLPTGLLTDVIGIGVAIEGDGIPFGSVITNITDTTHITMNNTATKSSNTIVKIFPWGNGNGIDTFNAPSKIGRVGIGAGKSTKVISFASSNINLSTNVITVPFNNTLYTGTQVKYSSTGIGGLSYGATYYVIRDSSTTIRLATSRANTVTGTVIDITSQGTGIHTLTVNYTERVVGEILGEEEHTVNINEMPSHNHQFWDNYGVQDAETTFNNGNAADEVERNEPTGYTGGSQAHNNMQPTVVVNYIVKY